MFCRAVILSVLLFPLAAFAQEPVVLPPAEVDLWHHRLGPEAAIHLTASEVKQAGRFFSMEGYLSFEIVVSSNGQVESALYKPRNTASKLSEHLEEAQAIELSRTFKPWLQDGVPVRVRVEDYVQLLPPERWAETHVPFPEPEQIDLSTLSIGLSRTNCYGSCPAYEVTLAGDGTIHFSGHVGTLVPGDHTAHISQDAVRELVSLFRKADFFSALDVYEANITDNPTQKITLTIGPLTKTVTDYVGTQEGLPLAIKNLEEQIDEATNTARWIGITPETLPSLLAEKWPFGAAAPQNLTLYNSVVAIQEYRPSPVMQQQRQALLQQFVAAKAPVISTDAKVPSPICTATASADLALVKSMAQGIKQFPTLVCDRCLAAAANRGELTLFQFWIDHGADLKAKPQKVESDWQASLGLLANAVGGGNPQIVRKVLDAGADVHAPIGNHTPILIWALQRSRTEHLDEIIPLLTTAGADPNARGNMGETPIFAAEWHPEAIKPLLAAGASLEARDNNGNTPLLRQAFNEAYVREVLADGADPTPTNKRGDTALKLANQYQCKPCAELIQAALTKRAAETASAP